MDAHIHNLSFEVVKGFIGEVQELLSQVADGTLPNWRHDVKSKISSDNGGVRSHQLARYVYYGDFNEEFLDEMTQYLNRVFNRKDGYNNLVLLPTLLRWIVIASYEMDGRMANYYLENGGSKKVESLTKEFVYKMKKKKAKR